LSSSSQTAVVCDTTAYLPNELLAARGVETISLYVAVDGHQERESEITDYAAFYERLRASESGATTSQPSIGDFVSVYEPLLDEGREIVSIHISAGISGTWEAAGQARDRLIAEGKGGERIHVVDSRSAAGGMGLPVLAASAAAAAEGDAATVVARARQAREELKMWFAIDTLEYLRRGGRIGGARAWIGSALKIKPILTLEEEITPVERVRTRARSIERLQDHAVGERVRRADAEAGVQDADHRELEYADVRRCRRHDRSDVDGEEDGGSGADAGLVAQSQSGEQRPAGGELDRPGRQLRGSGGEATAWVAEDFQPRSHLQQRPVQGRAEAGEATVSVAPHQRRAEQHDDQ
jgi:DegV family protein with EDD domain